MNGGDLKYFFLRMGFYITKNLSVPYSWTEPLEKLINPYSNRTAKLHKGYYIYILVENNI